MPAAALGDLLWLAAVPSHGAPFWLWKATPAAPVPQPLVAVQKSSDGSRPTRAYDFRPPPSPGKVLFVAQESLHDENLWVFDRALGTTTLLPATYPVIDATDLRQLTPVGDTLLFVLSTPGGVASLWQVDRELAISAVPSAPAIDRAYFATAVPLIAFRDRLYWDTVGGVWSIAGNSGGGGGGGATAVVLDTTVRASGITATETLLYFACVKASAPGLCVTEGTNGVSFIPVAARAPFAVGDRVYFIGNDTHGDELWVTNCTSVTGCSLRSSCDELATASGYCLLRDIITGAGSSNPVFVGATASGIYIRADESTPGAVALWFSDGTTAGTQRVAPTLVLRAGELGSTCAAVLDAPSGWSRSCSRNPLGYPLRRRSASAAPRTARASRDRNRDSDVDVGGATETVTRAPASGSEGRRSLSVAARLGEATGRGPE